MLLGAVVAAAFFAFLGLGLFFDFLPYVFFGLPEGDLDNSLVSFLELLLSPFSGAKFSIEFFKRCDFRVIYLYKNYILFELSVKGGIFVYPFAFNCLHH